MLNLRKYFVEFVAWERVPSSLPFGTDVVPKSRESIWRWNGNYSCTAAKGVQAFDWKSTFNNSVWYFTLAIF